MGWRPWEVWRVASVGPTPTGWPGEHPVLGAAACSVAIIAIFMPLTVARYRRVANR